MAPSFCIVSALTPYINQCFLLLLTKLAAKISKNLQYFQTKHQKSLAEFLFFGCIIFVISNINRDLVFAKEY
jgi:hypothetical protein